MSNKNYEKLLEPGYIGPVRTKMRLIKTGSNPGFFPYEDGNVQQPIIDYYEALAAGGVGLVTTGAGEIDYPIGTVPKWGYRMDDEKYIPSLKKLSDAIHKHDCPAFMQVFHMGPLHPEILSGQQPISASALTKEELPRPDFFISREMTLDDIKRVKERFVNGAVIAQKAGFQGIELNAACNHLINAFLSLAWNKRHDDYGCDTLENRARFLVEIIRETKEATGKDFPIMTMINSLEPGLKNGITLDESKEFAKMVEKAGSDAIHPRCEFYTNPKDLMKRDSTHFPDMTIYPTKPKNVEKGVDLSMDGQAAWVPAAAEIKKVVSIPVIIIGRLSPDLGEKFLREGKADFIGHNRRLMADHDLPKKIMEGRPEDIAPCTSCLICYDRVERGETPRCRINSALGKEKEYEIKPAEKKKKVLVIGGGPAGMEVARVAALRGHEVTLYEKMKKLGGSILVSIVVKGQSKEPTMDLINYFKIQLKKLGVKVNMGKKVTDAVIEKEKPDVITLTAGSKHYIPNIPGIHMRHVMTSQKLHDRVKLALKFADPMLLRWLTKFYMPVGKNVVVLGARLHGCQTAEFLVERGRKVTIVDTCKKEEVGDGLLETFFKPWLLTWLDDRGVPIIPEAKFEEINKKGLVITNKEGKKETIKADTIVTAMPMRPDNELYEKMKNKAGEVYMVGDTRDPGYIVDAIADGSRIARQF